MRTGYLRYINRWPIHIIIIIIDNFPVVKMLQNFVKSTAYAPEIGKLNIIIEFDCPS